MVSLSIGFGGLDLFRTRSPDILYNMPYAYYTTTTKAAECRRSIVIQSFSKPLNIFNVLEVCEVIIP